MYKNTQQKIEHVKETMADNIEKALVSGKKIDEIHGKVKEERIVAHTVQKAAQETYIRTASDNYGIAIITFSACALFALSVITGQPWPLHIVCLAVGGILGYGINYTRTQLHKGWLRAKLFGGSVLPSHQTTDDSQDLLNELNFLPSFNKTQTENTSTVPHPLSNRPANKLKLH